jgi:HPt (histidine-containing phosphotransfer) domain-containing protein
MQQAIDISYLRSMTLGDLKLEREVLELFTQQTGVLLDRLSDVPADAVELAHTLKGSARAIGAFDVGDAALALENALKDNANIAPAFAQLKHAANEAFDAIDVILEQGN